MLLRLASSTVALRSYHTTGLRLIGYFRLDQFGQQRQRFLPAQIARLGGNGRGDAFLRDVQLRSAEYFFQGDRCDHFSREIPVVELVRVAEEFVGLEFEILSAKGVALAGAEIGERHLVGSADFGVRLLDFAREAVRRKPLGHGVRIQERAIDPLRRRAEHSVKSNGVCVVGCHIRFVFLQFNITTNGADASGQLKRLSKKARSFGEGVNFPLRLNAQRAKVPASMARRISAEMREADRVFQGQPACWQNIQRRSRYFIWWVVTLLPACSFGEAVARDGAVTQSSEASLGTVEFPISCLGAAQPQFNRAVALLHHMTYPQARAAFERVAKSDPKCAMAHWGIAMTLFQPLWPTRPGPEELRRGWEEVQTAKALEPPTERERLFVAAAEAFFREPASPDYWERIRRWEQAMGKVHTAFPEDPEATAFYALAHLATAPANKISRTHADLAAKLLLGVLKQNPDHAGAMHYLVHANDVPGREQEEFEVVCGYEKVAPRNPHALHMPTHIYTRLGEWERVIRGNLLAAEAALELPAGNGQFVWDEFPHALEYLSYAYLQKGDDDQAAAQLKRLQGTQRLEPTFKTAFHTASTQARYALERRAWQEAMSLAPREPATLDWDRFPWPEAVTWFARGLAAAHQAAVGEGQRSARRLQELENVAARSGEELFTRNIRVLRLEVQAWLAHAREDEQSSVKLMREATELEGSTPKHSVTPAPTLPAYELLGDLLLEQKQPAEALAAYQRSLEAYPRRFNTLWGAARAARATGADDSAEAFYRELLKVAEAAGRKLALQEAKEFVDGKRRLALACARECVATETSTAGAQE